MTERTWVAGAAGDWFDPDNWVPAGAPEDGDTLKVVAGSPTIANAAIAAQTIILGGGPVTLDLTSVSFGPGSAGPMRIAIRGGDDAVPASVSIVSRGTISLVGQLAVETVGGGTLVIDVNSDGTTADFVIDEAGFLFVNQESLLVLKGEQVTNHGLVHIEGRARIEPGLSLTGEGLIEIDDGGHLVVEGTIGEGQTVIFGGGTGDLTIANPAGFAASLALTQYGGDRIHLDGLKAKSATVVDDVLTLFSGKNHTGSVVAEIPVKLVNPADFFPLPSNEQILKGRDFSFERDGEGGTLITYAPRGPTWLEASLPVPVIAETESTVPLEAIFKQAFGTKDPGFYGVTLLTSTTKDASDDFWGQPDVNGIDPVVSAWIVNGEAVAGPYTVRPGDKVELLVGNAISFPPQIQVRLTEAEKGRKAEFLTYDVWTVDPAVADLVHAGGGKPGAPVAADIVASAEAYQAVYGTVFNRELCNWIADNVAAAAGATMPLPDAYLDPSLNVPGGFWRVAYSGAATDMPVGDWNKIVKAGDIVRLEWAATATGHTTTVLAVNEDGSITVYDNINVIDGDHTIGEHGDVEYWKKTDPAGITIYRLDPDQQYLIRGTQLGEFLQGTVFDDLIRGHAGADLIRGSIGGDAIRAGRGTDTVHGGRGNDELAGGLQGDELYGGRGADAFVYGRLADSLPGSGRRDTIHGFESGRDRIDLSQINDRIAAKGGEPLHFLGKGPVKPEAGALTYHKGSGHLLVRADVDGDGHADFEIKVLGAEKLDAGDFIL